jgi:hypothetical protein
MPQLVDMATQNDSDSARSDSSLFRDFSETMDRYLSLQVSFLGVLFMIFGYLVQFTNPGWTDSGVWTVVLFLWGLVLFLLGLVVFGILWWSHQGSGR